MLKKVKIKERNADLKSALEPYIRQAPNSRFAGLIPFKLWFYALADRGKENKLKWWMKNKLGEPISLIDTVKVNESRVLMKKLLRNKGYFNVVVNPEIRYGKRKSKVNFKINKNKPYYISEVSYKTSFSRINHFLKNIMEESLLISGDLYDIDVFEKERQRLVNELKNHGIYYFHKDMVFFELDTTKRKHEIDVLVKLNPVDNKKFVNSYMIKNVYIHPDYSFVLADTNLKVDTFQVEQLKIITHDIGHFNWDHIERNIVLSPGQKYRFSDYSEYTYKNLAGLGIFNYIDIVFEDIKSDSVFKEMDCHIYLKSAKSQEMGLELEGNTGTGIQEGRALGTALKYSYRNKNLFRGAEILNLNLHGGLETQIDKGASLVNTVNFKAQVRLDVPKIIGPISRYKVGKRFSPKTHFDISYDYQYRPGYLTLNTSNISFGYDWNEDINKKHVLNPIVINYLQSEYEGNLENLVNTNQQIKNSLEDQWVIGTKYNFIINNQIIKPNSHFGIYHFSADFSGNAINSFSRLMGVSDQIKVFGVDYSQYAKFEVDLRQYFNFNRKRFLVFRFNVGAGFAIGNSSVLPYVKQFFLGGANSMRAWRARTLGPGSYFNQDILDPDKIIDQTGDFKLEANAEYRFNFSNVVKGGFFVDVGNIWNLKKDDLRPGAELKSNLTDIKNELAVGAGFGLRLDFSFFVFRTDLGVKIYDPILLDYIEQSDDNLENYNFMNINFAIGYPF